MVRKGSCGNIMLSTALAATAFYCLFQHHALCGAPVIVQSSCIRGVPIGMSVSGSGGLQPGSALAHAGFECERAPHRQVCCNFSHYVSLYLTYVLHHALIRNQLALQ